MKDTQHTPGPWTCVEVCSPLRGEGGVLKYAYGLNGTGGNTPAISPQEAAANARLIAAAPAMLEALKSAALTFAAPKQDLQAEKNAIQHSYKMVCAAIRLAVGETDQEPE